jgi:DNA topoisomerase-1
VLNLDRKGLIKLPAGPPLEVDVPCPKCGSNSHLRRGKRGPWLACSAFPKCRGRTAWTGLDQPGRARLEAQLAEHERTNPLPILRHVNGTPVAPGSAPNPIDKPAEPAEP